MAYVISNKNKNYLNGFFPNGLPIDRNFKYKSKGIFEFSKSKYSIFSSEKECIERIEYIKNEIVRNSYRYEQSLIGSTEKLLKVVDGLYPTTD